jgi:cysteine desulfurase/selenocysteine lyase
LINIRKNFPILSTSMSNHPLVYLDNAATTQKPKAVIESLNDFYTKHSANIHRTVYRLAEQATTLYEGVREQVARWLGANSCSEIIFTKGTTEGINFIAAAWGRKHITEGDEIVISALEHHSNLLPWQQLCHEKGAVLKIIPLQANGMLAMDKARELITKKTKLVAVAHISNILGTHIDVAALAEYAHAVGAKILVDAAQSVPHQPINLQALNCDFFVFSGHKMFAPTGVGVLYIKKELHDQIPPYQFGGGMVYEASYHHATWLPAPQKFEAGTPPIAQVIGLGAAIDFLMKEVDFNSLTQYEASLCTKLIDGLSTFDRVQLLGPVQELKKNGHLASFVVEGVHAHDAAAFMDSYGICVRAGHHCAQPLAKELGLDAAVRVSFACYNTPQEVDFFLDVFKKMIG